MALQKMKKNYYKDIDWDNKIPDKIYFDEIYRISKNQVIFGYNYFAHFLKNTRCFLVWDKTIHGNSYADCDLIYTSFNQPARYYRENICQIENEGKRVHPTQKSIKFLAWILKNYSKPGEIVFDPFAGSGTTALSCLEMGNPYILIEKEKDYFDIINKRIKLYHEQLKLF